MKQKPNYLTLHIPDPFDASVQARLIHMDILDESGCINESAMSAMAGIFSGLFFDDLCDFYQNTKELWSIYQIFAELYEKKDHQHLYLFLSIQYDNMRKPLPDPVWFLAGNDAAVKTFMLQFMERYRKLMAADGFLEAHEEVGEI